MEGQTWKGKRKKVNGGMDLFLFWVVFSVCLSAITTATGALADEQGPDPVERALGIPGLKNRWDAITSWVKLKFIDFRSNLGENKSYGRSKSSRPDVVVKEAATKSAETGKETVLKAAKSAAEVVDDAFYRAKEKVKKTLSFTKKSPPDDHEDL